MDFSLMMWGAGDASRGEGLYELALATAKYGDENGYSAIWIPERHFHPWGGRYPNPSVVCAALAAVTTRIRLRAGSIVLPLHDPIRVAEEWAVVDNLSNGRVEVSVASGWKDDDFILAPERYEDRREAIWDNITAVQRLWRGETLRARNGRGHDREVAVYPRPVQPELPMWITSAGSIRTMTDAGGAGFDLLTHLLGQDFDDLEKQIAQYNAYRARGSFERPGKVSLMLHTFLSPDRERVRETVREPLAAFLTDSVDLALPAKDRATLKESPTLQGELIARVSERLLDGMSLLGTPESCHEVVSTCARVGVTEICCLVDFGLPTLVVLEGLRHLTELKNFAQR